MGGLNESGFSPSHRVIGRRMLQMDENSQLELAQENQSETGIDSQAQAEKMLTQSQVNKIVQSAKEQAAQKARREAEEKYQSELERLAEQKANATSSKEEMDVEKLHQELEEKYNQKRQQEQLEKEMQVVADKYLTTVESAKKQYDDYDKIMADFDPQEFPEIVVLLSNVENAPDVLYELGKNSGKLANIDYWAKRSPRTAAKELKKLSDSIRMNQDALAEAASNGVSAPLDRLQPTNVTGSNGKKSINDLRKADWLRV